MRALLDINVLIALLDADHVHHGRARTWLEAEISRGWATCPLTQNGCVRVLSQLGYPAPVPARDVIGRLRDAVAHPSHEFWPDDVSLLDDRAVDAARVLGPRQVTDLYLLALAVRHGGRFATFDGGVPRSPVHGARPEQLVVL
jgi:toxin-antitoxin system PIN domain toxin